MADAEHSGAPSTRRAFLRRAGLGAAGLAVGGPAFLAACSKSASRAQEVRVFNAPLGVDDNTAPLFETGGVFLRYHEYTDAATYLKQVTPGLAAHRDIGADIVVLPDAQTAEVIASGFVRRLPGGVAAGRIVPAFANPRFDPGRHFSLPWSSSVVGLAYDRKRLREPIRSVGALFDPTHKGKVVFSADPAATLGMTMFASGQDPSAVTADQADAAMQRVAAAFAAGQIRSFANAEYLDDLVTGRALLAIARSDEIRDAQQITPSLAFVVPSEGGLLESTNMVVPLGARNVAEAGKFVNFVFSPTTSARFASFGSKAMAVVGADRILQQIDPKASVDPIVEPPPPVWARLKIWGGSAATDRATSQLASFAAAHLS